MTTVIIIIIIIIINYTFIGVRGGAVGSRHCATSRKVAGSIPDGISGIFHWYNPSGSTMALGLTQPLA